MAYIKRDGHLPAFRAWTGTEDDYPWNSLIGVFFTRRGALRAIRREERSVPHRQQRTIWHSEDSEEAHDAAGEAWQAGAYPSGVTDPAETSGPRGMP